MSLVQKRALITGASSGIGRATAIAFAKAGIDIALVSRQKDRLESVAKEARNLGVEAKAFPLDLAKVEQVHTQIDSIVAAFGSVNILVNNAGMGYTGDLIETSLADWQKVIDLNLTSVFQCIKKVFCQGCGIKEVEPLLMLFPLLVYRFFPTGGLTASVNLV